jgi:Cys-rich protein (TIGR01571 family)
VWGCFSEPGGGPSSNRRRQLESEECPRCTSSDGHGGRGDCWVCPGEAMTCSSHGTAQATGNRRDGGRYCSTLTEYRCITDIECDHNPAGEWEDPFGPAVVIALLAFYGLVALCFLIGFLIACLVCGPKQPGFSSSLGDCTQDMGVCCLTCWCPCIPYGEIGALAFDQDSTLMMGAYLLAQCGGMHTCLAMASRNELRKKLQIGPAGEWAADVCIHCCAHGCALCQERREVDRVRSGERQLVVQPATSPPLPAPPLIMHMHGETMAARLVASLLLSITTAAAAAAAAAFITRSQPWGSCTLSSLLPQRRRRQAPRWQPQPGCDADDDAIASRRRQRWHRRGYDDGAGAAGRHARAARASHRSRRRRRRRQQHGGAAGAERGRAGRHEPGGQLCHPAAAERRRGWPPGGAGDRRASAGPAAWRCGEALTTRRCGANSHKSCYVKKAIYYYVLYYYNIMIIHTILLYSRRPQRCIASSTWRAVTSLNIS